MVLVRDRGLERGSGSLRLQRQFDRDGRRLDPELAGDGERAVVQQRANLGSGGSAELEGRCLAPRLPQHIENVRAGNGNRTLAGEVERMTASPEVIAVPIGDRADRTDRDVAVDVIDAEGSAWPEVR